MLRIEGADITIGDELAGSSYHAGHPDLGLVLKTGETVHLPLAAIRFAISVLAVAHECRDFADLWRAVGGECEWEWPKTNLDDNPIDQVAIT